MVDQLAIFPTACASGLYAGRFETATRGSWLPMVTDRATPVTINFLSAFSQLRVCD
ncbi:hypothetical protein Pan189_20460 [Stratiformator vulcanicus]|uniref:Uncharacterized protein n=1 Tax=Stratiformator vulcanicus TaxID=2527980 RepID=A0A517R1B6_9PLAN|nr:hypothetical protein Pan189_20460 [Stratiformator vulcanicus]